MSNGTQPPRPGGNVEKPSPGPIPREWRAEVVRILRRKKFKGFGAEIFVVDEAMYGWKEVSHSERDRFECMADALDLELNPGDVTGALRYMDVSGQTNKNTAGEETTYQFYFQTNERRRMYGKAGLKLDPYKTPRLIIYSSHLPGRYKDV